MGREASFPAPLSNWYVFIPLYTISVVLMHLKVSQLIYQDYADRRLIIIYLPPHVHCM